jgi:hypothetical protein
LAAGASATTISFSGANGALISQDNGDGGGLDVSYATIGGPGGSLKTWTSGFHGGNTVAYAGCASCVGQITLDPGAGQTVVVDTIGVAAWSPAFSNITIFNEDFSQVLYSHDFGLGKSNTYTVGVSSAAPIHIQWGQDAYNIGISSIGVSMLSTPQGLPEPGTGLLMLAAAAVLGASRMRARD